MTSYSDSCLQCFCNLVGTTGKQRNYHMTGRTRGNDIETFPENFHHLDSLILLADSKNDNEEPRLSFMLEESEVRSLKPNADYEPITTPPYTTETSSVMDRCHGFALCTRVEANC